MDVGLGHYPSPVARDGLYHEQKVEPDPALKIYVHLHVYPSTSR